jgi:hypothetical protein
MPVNEFVDGVLMTPLRVRAGQIVSDCGVCVLEVRQPQGRFRCGSSCSRVRLPLHDR